MFKVQSIALSAAICVLHYARTASAAGCQPVWQEVDYEVGDMVSAFATIETGNVSTSDTYNFECSREAPFCGQRNPADPIHGSTVWTMENVACSGTAPTLAPTTVPIPAPWSGTGCPAPYASGTDYDEESLVSVDMGAFSLVYRCREGPIHLFCPMVGFEPGTGPDYMLAWVELGSCTGTMMPTGSPINVMLVDVGGCPESYIANSDYEEGDMVENVGLAYRCKDSPAGLNCPQAGYEPGTGVAWENAWSVLGHCEGTMMPTTAPSFVTLADVGGCSESFIANSDYEEGDMVSVTISQLPLRQVAYECMAWPASNYCGQLRPDEFGGNLGWSLLGSCDGSIGPTSSPSFDSLTFISNPSGCPEEFSSASTYEAGDLASVTLSTTPERKVVYECRPWPNTAYCNQQGASLDPGQKFGHLGWTLNGACTGTLAPTISPTLYVGTCEYTRCITETNCNPGDLANTISGSTDCSCGIDDEQSDLCTQTTCTIEEVEPYDSSTSYAEGDVVRLVTQQFTCRVPGWCNQSSYQPEIVDGIWMQAWTKDDVCA